MGEMESFLWKLSQETEYNHSMVQNLVRLADNGRNIPNAVADRICFFCGSVDQKTVFVEKRIVYSECVCGRKVFLEKCKKRKELESVKSIKSDDQPKRLSKKRKLSALIQASKASKTFNSSLNQFLKDL